MCQKYADKIPISEQDRAYNKNFKALDINRLESQYNFSEVEIEANKICLTSRSKDQWIIVYNRRKHRLCLYHKNKRAFYKDRYCDTSKYHAEKIRFDNVIQVLEYIKGHDTHKLLWKYSKTIHQKSYTDYLFEKLYKIN